MSTDTLATDPEILLSIPSRNRPEGAAAVMELLIESAYDPDCFGFQLVIDSDQVALYQPVIEKFPGRILLGVVEHGGSGLRNVFVKQLEQFIASKSYFLWSLTDDVFGVVNHWDRYLLRTKHLYSDDIFLLGSSCLEWGRSTDVFKSCYCLDSHSTLFQRAAKHAVNFNGVDYTDPLDLDFLVLYEFCELFPAYTHRFAEFIQPLFLQAQHQVGLDIMVAALVQQIYRVSGINRHVIAFPDNIRHINHNAMDKCVKDSFAQNKPMDMRAVREVAQDAVLEICRSAMQGRNDLLHSLGGVLSPEQQAALAAAQATSQSSDSTAPAGSFYPSGNR